MTAEDFIQTIRDHHAECINGYGWGEAGCGKLGNRDRDGISIKAILVTIKKRRIRQPKGEKNTTKTASEKRIHTLSKTQFKQITIASRFFRLSKKKRT